MKLDKLRLRNFCQHQELDWTFLDGITAITGPNGGGKSNAIKGAYAALTGDFKRNEGVLSENISKTCSDKDESFVELSFSTPGGKAVIKRNLRPNKRSLIVNSMPPLTGDREVTTAIEGLVGVSSNILSDYIFVDQWQMFSIFTLPKSDRLSALQSLYGLDKAELCYDEINKYSSKILVQVPSETVESVLAQIREKTLLLESISQSLKEVSLNVVDDTTLQKDLSEVRRKKDIQRDVQKSSEALNIVLSRLNEAEESRPAISVKVDELSLVKDSDSALTEYKKHQYQWGLIRKYDSSKAANEEQLAIIEESISVLVASAPIKPSPYIESSGLDFEKYSKSAGALEAKKQNLIQLTSKKECPVCGTTGEVLLAAIDAISKHLVETSPLIDHMKKQYQLSREYDTANYKHASDLSGLNSKLELIKLKLQSERPEQPTISEDEVNKFISTFTDLRASYESLSLKLADLDSRIAQLKAGRDSVVSHIETRSKECNLSQNYDMQERALCDSINLVNQDREKKIRFEEQSKATVENLDYLYTRRDKLVGDIEEARVNKTAKDHFDNLKEVMHKSNLPKRLAVNYLKRTVIKLNEYLEDFNAPFRIYSDDELVFWAKFNDGRDLPAARLSGGEKVVLALAFRLAVQFGVASGVNLLVLDEPTVGLDDDNIECLDTAFNRLRAMSKSSGLQVIVVSHEKAMERMCDHTLTLYK
jgi:DNA repair exonuclease SbcCD ATPase subunit